ncbi:MAG: cysteine hydrolase [Phycisphaerae bacterium]|nr:cysteine hydrolase [Phycisphaerae bacterium]
MKKALVVIDVQKLYTDEESDMYCEDSAATVDQINKLISEFEKRKEPIYLIRHVHKVDGSDLGRMFDFSGEPEEDFNFKEGSDEVEYDDRLKIPKSCLEIVKNRYSAFEGTDLEKHLQKAKVEGVVICGFMTNFCCESTARSAHDKDYFVDFVLDATGTPGTENIDEKEMRKFVGECLESGFSRVMSTEDFMSERNK